MTEFQFETLSDAERTLLLSAFGYGVEENGDIIDRLMDEKIISQVTKKPLNLKDVALLSGSLKVTDSDPLTLSKYLRENIEDGS